MNISHRIAFWRYWEYLYCLLLSSPNQIKIHILIRFDFLLIGIIHFELNAVYILEIVFSLPLNGVP